MLAADPDIQEITMLAPDRVFVQKDGVRTRSTFLFPGENAYSVEIARLVAKLGGDRTKPAAYTEGFLPSGVHARVMWSPLATELPVCQVNRAADQSTTMAALQSKGAIDETKANLLGDLVRAGRSVLVVGPPNAGRSALVNALGMFVKDAGLIVLVEERPEIHLPHEGIVRLHATHGADDVFLRLRTLQPDALIVGSFPVRDLPTYVETAHEISTQVLAATSGRDLESFLLQARAVCDASSANVQAGAAFSLLREALDVIVLVERDADGGFVVARVANLRTSQDGDLGLVDLV